MAPPPLLLPRFGGYQWSVSRSVREKMCRSGLLVLLWTGLPLVVDSFGHLNSNLCKWCDASSPLCRDGVCFSNCSLSSFCNTAEEICVAIWRKTNNTMTVHTMCHDPTLPLEGIAPSLLLNFSASRECHMTSQQPAVEDAAVMVCGCHGEDECNDQLIFYRGANGFSRLLSRDVVPVVLLSLLPPLCIALVTAAAFYFYRVQHSDKPDHPARLRWPPKQVLDPSHRAVGLLGAGSQNWIDQSQAGEGTELLPIKLEALVGRGRFAEVWRGCMLDGQGAGLQTWTTVAVKVFPAVEETSWRNETSVLSDPDLQHDNIVRFLAAEERGPPGHTHRKYWLVLAYYGLGNMQDFLTSNTLSWEELVALAASVAKGLAYLHSDTTARGAAKVPVAHRDLKSSNIVVQSRTRCVLCDFGLALRLDESLTVDDFANSGQVGTARYMAPEVLESRVNLEDMEAFKQMDIYSMSLVLWEMASRCRVIGEVRSYEPAFGSQVCDQPCVDSMRDLVLRDRGRPDLPAAWMQHQGMKVFCSTLAECWDQDPEARLTASCVVERLATLREEDLGAGLRLEVEPGQEVVGDINSEATDDNKATLPCSSSSSCPSQAPPLSCATVRSLTPPPV